MSAADDRAEARILLPGQQARLVGHQAAKEEMLRAFSSGRAHHAWLVSGPAGVGKATFAWHMARLLLACPGAALADAPAEGVAAEHPVFQQMAGLAHADFFLLRRTRDKPGGRLRARIAVEDARALGHFLSLKSASGGRRVVIVDAADEMNASTANAILKLLEEPPPRTHFLLVSHAPGRLLPTIRSRCVHLPLQPLAAREVREVLAGHSWLEEAPSQALDAAVAMSGGAPGRALDLAASKALALWEQARAALEAGEARALAKASAQVAQALAPAQARDDLLLFTELLQGWARQRMQEAARAGDAARAARWADALEDVERRMAAREVLNLDRRQFVEAALQRLFKVNRDVVATN